MIQHCPLSADSFIGPISAQTELAAIIEASNNYGGPMQLSCPLSALFAAIDGRKPIHIRMDKLPETLNSAGYILSTVGVVEGGNCRDATFIHPVGGAERDPVLFCGKGRQQVLNPMDFEFCVEPMAWLIGERKRPKRLTPASIPAFLSLTGKLIDSSRFDVSQLVLHHDPQSEGFRDTLSSYSANNGMAMCRVERFVRK